MTTKRILIYPGFHKTGTTSAQKALGENRLILSDEAQVFLRDDMRDLCEAARSASADLSPKRLAVFFDLAVELSGTLSKSVSNKIVLASEDLCGHMPGRQGVTSYATAAPVLMDNLARALKMHDLVFLFSIRGKDRWLASCYAQHLKYTRIKLTAEQYAAKHAPAADLDAVIDSVRDVTGAQVLSAKLEDTARMKYGPLTPVLDLLDIPSPLRERLSPPRHHNASPGPEDLDWMLQLNRSDLPYDVVRATKKQMRRTARRASRKSL